MLYILRHSERCDDKDLHPNHKTAPIIPSDPQLSHRGRQMALATGFTLRNMIPRSSVPLYLISSPYRRCLETAWKITHSFPEIETVMIDYRICEALSVDFFERNPLPELTIVHDKSFQKQGTKLQYRSKLEPTFPENRAATEQRNLTQLKGFEQAMANGGYNVIVVGHGCFANDVCAHFERKRSKSAGNCAITKLVMDKHSRRFRLEMAKSCAHLSAFPRLASKLSRLV